MTAPLHIGPFNRRVDMKHYTFITTTYDGRLPMLIATLGNVMHLVHHADFVVMWYGDSGTDAFRYATRTLDMIAEGTSNYVTFYAIGDGDDAMSVAETKTAFEPAGGTTHFVNLDDDLLVTKESLAYLRLLWLSPVVTIGVQDVENVRGFADFDTRAYESMEEFLQYHPIGKAKHHRFKHVGTENDYGYISQLWCMRRDVYENPETWRVVKERFTQKGIRGYDICLEQELVRQGYPITLVTGCEALHIGLEHGYIGGPWKAADAIAKPVVTTRDGYKTVGEQNEV